jgi:hypothetical protein
MISENDFIPLKDSKPEWTDDFLCLCKNGENTFYRVIRFEFMIGQFEADLPEDTEIIAWAIMLDPDILKTRLLN